MFAGIIYVICVLAFNFIAFVFFCFLYYFDLAGGFVYLTPTVKSNYIFLYKTVWCALFYVVCFAYFFDIMVSFVINAVHIAHTLAFKISARFVKLLCIFKIYNNRISCHAILFIGVLFSMCFALFFACAVLSFTCNIIFMQKILQNMAQKQNAFINRKYATWMQSGTCTTLATPAMEEQKFNSVVRGNNAHNCFRLFLFFVLLFFFLL